MNLPTNYSAGISENLIGSRKAAYGLFFLLGIALIVLGLFQLGHLGILIPVSLLLLTYAKYIRWIDLLRVYLLILFLVPISPYKLFGDLPVDIEPNRLFAILLLFLWVSSFSVDPRLKFKRTGLEAPLVALFASLIISIAVNLESYSQQELAGATKAVFLFVSYIFVFYLVVSVLKSYSEVESIIRWVALLSVTISAFGIFERITEYNIFKHLHEFLPFLQISMDGVGHSLVRGELRISSSADHPIGLAALLTVLMPPLFFLFYESKILLGKIWYGFGLLVNLIAVLFTVSATALLGIATVLITQLVMSPRRGLRLLLIITLFALLSGMVFYDDYAHLMQRISYDYLLSSEINNEYGRLTDYPKVWQEFLNRPFFGRGYGTFNPLENFYLDNQYLGFIVEIGAIGIICIAWLIYSLLFKLHRVFVVSSGSRAELPKALLSSVMAFVAVNFAFDAFGFAQVVYTFFVLAGLGVVIEAVGEESALEMEGDT